MRILANPLAFGADEAVPMFDVGIPGEVPRAIAIDVQGYIWVGFYSGGYLAKYQYTRFNLTLVDVPFRLGKGTANNIKFYEMNFAPNGTLFISSSSSTPTRSGVEGVYSFNTATKGFTLEWAVSPYAVLINPITGPSACPSYSNLFWIHGTGTVTITDATSLRDMAFGGLGKYGSLTLAVPAEATAYSGTTSLAVRADTLPLPSGTHPLV